MKPGHSRLCKIGSSLEHQVIFNHFHTCYKTVAVLLSNEMKSDVFFPRPWLLIILNHAYNYKINLRSFRRLEYRDVFGVEQIMFKLV